MRFGGHETFTLREGWLVKGLNLLLDNPKAFFDKNDLANALGVGVNMGKSIEHWLLATKLVTKNPLQTAREKGIKYELTELAQVIHKHDPFMTQEETWWILHMKMIQNPDYAATWDWFFNDYGEMKFDKIRLIKRLMDREKTLFKKMPSRNTIERDISCFLNTYAQPIPREIKDPEEDYGCPFQELRLMNHQKNSGTYELLRRPRKICPELFLYSLSQTNGEIIGSHDFTLSFLSKQRSGPLQAFCLSSEGLFELAMEVEQSAAQYGYSIRSLAGDRQIVFSNPGTVTLLSNMYKAIA
jgi:hypothetical protein